MSKVVTIPCCMSPFEVIVNGVAYKYAAGSVVEVPDEVAAVIENHMGQHPEHSESQEVLTAKVGQIVVVAEVDENGKPTKWQAADLPTGGPKIFEVNFTPDGNGNAVSDKSPEDVMAAIAGGEIVVAKWEDENDVSANVAVGGSADNGDGMPWARVGVFYWHGSVNDGNTWTME